MKYFLIVAGFLLLAGCTPVVPSKIPVTFATQEECEHTTSGACSFVTCDYIPEGKTFDEVCGKGFTKGWTSFADKRPQEAQK